MFFSKVFYMSFLKRIFGHPERNQSSSKSEKNSPSSREVAKDPVLFAQWINKYIVLHLSFEDDQHFVPPKEYCERWKISDDERRLCANECVLLRALGACLFVRKNLDEEYYLKFRDSLMPAVEERMNRNAPHMHKDNVYEALNQYLDALKSDNHVAFSMTYLDRVYPDTPCGEAMFIAGLPVKLGLNQIMLNSFDAVRDGYSMLLTGMRYDALKKLDDLMKDNSGDQK
jgi:hypothetical protein